MVTMPAVLDPTKTGPNGQCEPSGAPCDQPPDAPLICRDPSTTWQQRRRSTRCPVADSVDESARNLRSER
jgi:hypothetical protein